MDCLIVSLDLRLPVDSAADPLEYTTLMQQMTHHLHTVFGIEVKLVAGTMSESVYDDNAQPEATHEPES